jgi:hypothetical protein
MSASTSSSAAANRLSRRGTIANARDEKIASRRTTITLSPESQQIVERFKSASGTSTSAAIDRIIQQSDPKPSRLKVSDLGLLVLDLPEDREIVHFTIEDIKQAEDDMDREYVERLMQRSRTPASNRSRTGRRK